MPTKSLSEVAWEHALAATKKTTVSMDHINAGDKAKTVAAKLLNALSVGAMPNVDATDEGDVMLDWDDGSDPSVTLVVDPSGRVFFAVRSAAGRMSGKLYCKHGDPCPQLLVDTVAGLLRSVVMERYERVREEEWQTLIRPQVPETSVERLDSPSSPASWLRLRDESGYISPDQALYCRSSWPIVTSKTLKRPRYMSRTREGNPSTDASLRE